MSDKIAEVSALMEQEGRAAQVASLWDDYQTQRQVKLNQWEELRNYLFATDTSTTSNAMLPWKNSTTVPKLCQIRDNLHANYMAALFPNDAWLRWESYKEEADIVAKAKTIEAYIGNKCRQSDFKTTMSRLVYDYIDYGNAFCKVGYENKYTEIDSGDLVKRYQGPVVYRISPNDIVFNPTADSFENTFKIIRYVKTLGEIRKMAEDEPENAELMAAVERRSEVGTKLSGFSRDDFIKFTAYNVDGFGNLYDYYTSGYVELLEFYGTLYNSDTGEMEENKIITVMDRCKVIRDRKQSSWFGSAPIYHVGWRFRPDNLWAMGPLDNLVGMQYRIDHIENSKADAYDLAIHPPLKIKGDVPEFRWGPGEEILLGEDGDVQEMAKNAQWVVQANSEIQMIEQKMEEFAGAPKQAMGIRTPGEKTAYEVSQLQNAAGRIFQEKADNFEVSLEEPALNAMLEASRRNMGNDVVKVLDDDLAVEQFMSITKEDITATGILRPIGARHFSATAQLVQNLTQLSASNIGQLITPHISTVKLAELIEDTLGLSRYDLVTPNIGIEEKIEQQRLLQDGQEQLQVEQQVAQGAFDGDSEQDPTQQMQQGQ